MAPDVFNQTTTSLCSSHRWNCTNTSYNSYVAYIDNSHVVTTLHHDVTIGWCDNHYFTTITNSSYQQKVKKLLKKMKNEMCKRGWINPMPYYFLPPIKSMELRGVRFDGRGWANN